MDDSKCIGKVTATENKPSTCSTVQFWLKDDVLVRPFDIVRIKHISSNESDYSYTYAMIKDLHYITDSVGHLANYVSSDFGDIDTNPRNERLGTTIAQADILSNDQNVEMPIRDGAQVEWATSEEIRRALGINRFIESIPAGFLRMSSSNESIRVDFESSFLIGDKAAHLNISGISGLATKTSYAMFLLSSLQQKLSDKISIIIFNVKGPDLLSIDLPYNPETNKDKTKWQHEIENWERCDLKPEPLKNVTYIYPFSKSFDPYYTSSRIRNYSDIIESQISNNQAFNYYYDIQSFLGGANDQQGEINREKLSLLFSDIDDPTTTMESCIHAIGEISAENWEQFKEYIDDQTRPSGNRSSDITIASWRKFQRVIRTRTSQDIFTNKYYDDSNRRMIQIFDVLKNLKRGKILVIDIEPLPDFLQCLVVGDVLRTVFDAKLGVYEDEGIISKELGKVIVFADELNKYAPSTSGSRDRTLARWLLEVTERGRSLGVVLFGAEQFRSGVHNRVLGNCSTNAHGRTNAVEIAKAADYKHSFSSSNKDTLTKLSQGEMLIQHSMFNTPLIKVRFPFPAYRQLGG
ncbi:MAG: ATP-binding protein [Asgard group archaeon]|nr:ATP-binding protein [Asgard group archaeon]